MEIMFNEIIKRKPIRIDRLPALIPEEKRQVKLTPYMKEKEAFGVLRKSNSTKEKEFALLVVRLLHTWHILKLKMLR